MSGFFQTHLHNSDKGVAEALHVFQRRSGLDAKEFSSLLLTILSIYFCTAELQRF